MLENLKKEVLDANLRLASSGLVVLTWGNVSAVDRKANLVAIKPSGVPYDGMTLDDIVIVDFDGNIVDGKLNPSSDTPTHLYMYKQFTDVNSVVHTHSTYATAFAQAEKEIPPFGTTHADTFYGSVPLTDKLTKAEIDGDYELNTGKAIVRRFANADYRAQPGVLVSKHGVFSWGKDSVKAVDNAVIIEEVAKMAYMTLTLNPSAAPVDSFLLDKHYMRKHGKNAYYGQK